jgi:hypothetical protein
VVISRLSDRPAWQWGAVALLVVLMVAGDFVVIENNWGRLGSLNVITSNRAVVYALLAGAAGLAGLRLLAGRPAAQLASFAVFCGVMQTLSVHAPCSREVYGRVGQPEQWQLYHASVQLAQTWKRYARKENVPHLWYRNSTTDYDVASVGFVVLGDTLHSKWGGGPGMPEITPYEMQRLTNVPERCVILMAKDPQELEHGKEALRAAGMQLRLEEQTTIANGTLLIHVEIVQATKASAP